MAVDQHSGRRRQGHCQQGKRQSSPPKGGKQADHERRPDEIELFLDAQRPGVQQGFQIRRRVPVASLKIEDDVGRRGQRAHRRAGEALEIVRCEDESRRDKGRDDRGRQGRNDAAYTAKIKSGKAEAGLGRLARDNRGDQEAGNDEEHVDAHESAGERFEAQVKQHDGRDGERAQPSMSGRY